MLHRLVALGLGLAAGLPSLAALPSLALAQDWTGARASYQAPAEMVGVPVSDPRSPLTTPFVRVGLDLTIDARLPTLVDADGDEDAAADAIGFGFGGVAVLAMPLFPNLAVGGRGALHDALISGCYSRDCSAGTRRTWDIAGLVELRLPLSTVGAFYFNGFGGLSGSASSPGLHGGGSIGMDSYFGRHVGLYVEWTYVHRRVTHDLGNEETLVTSQVAAALGLIGRL